MSKTLNKIIGLRELREDTETYINAVAKGKYFTVMRKSIPIFKIVPVDKWGDEGEWVSLLDLRDGVSKNGVDAVALVKKIRSTHIALSKAKIK